MGVPFSGCALFVYAMKKPRKNLNVDAVAEHYERALEPMVAGVPDDELERLLEAGVRRGHSGTYRLMTPEDFAYWLKVFECPLKRIAEEETNGGKP